MNKFQSLFFGASVAAATVTAVSFAPSAAEAVTLVGNVTINGNVDIRAPIAGQLLLDFIDVDDITATPNFSNFLPPLSPGSNNTTLPYNPGSGAIIDVKDLILTSKIPTLDDTTNYEVASVTTQFLNFGTRTLNGVTGNLSFDLDPVKFIANLNGALSFPRATGVWKFNGDTIATGAISATDFGSGSYTISATAVPEPLTMGGLALGVGFGGFLKTRYSKKEKQLKKV